MTPLGLTFIRDASNPRLGLAYRDPSNKIIWGGISLDPRVRLSLKDPDDASFYCKSLGARLPTKKDFTLLSKELGGNGKLKKLDGSDVQEGNTPFSKDGKTPVLPGFIFVPQNEMDRQLGPENLSQNFFWVQMPMDIWSAFLVANGVILNDDTDQPWRSIKYPRTQFV